MMCWYPNEDTTLSKVADKYDYAVVFTPDTEFVVNALKHPTGINQARLLYSRTHT